MVAVVFVPEPIRLKFGAPADASRFIAVPAGLIDIVPPVEVIDSPPVSEFNDETPLEPPPLCGIRLLYAITLLQDL